MSIEKQKIDYTTDDFPIDGCKVIIEFKNGQYSFRVYRPGTSIEASLPSLEAYAFRPIWTLGVVLDAFARRIKPSQKKLENAYKKIRKRYSVTE